MAAFIRNSVCGGTFDVTSRYSNLQLAGITVNGLVCSATDSVTRQVVAIKKIPRPFGSADAAKQTLKQIKLFKYLQHENVVSLHDMFISPLEDIYLVTEFTGIDLGTILGSKPLDNQFIQYFVYQILRGLKYIHSAGIVHRDLKPSKILIDQKCDLKIADFYSARQTDARMTGYVATRFYRAPEIMLTWQQYGVEVDIWSVGCIFAEMIEGTPLFPGESPAHQLHVITELLGSIPDYVVNRISTKNTMRYIQSLPELEKQSLETRLKHAQPDALDLIGKMLHYDPLQRIDAATALTHPYLSRYHDPNDEPVAKEPFDYELSNMSHSIESWKHFMYTEILSWGRVDDLATIDV
ncbi:hypothetical protein AWENTII_009267 [Aspergillus wentii]|nr:MAPK protein hog1 [Aspergillus wentii]